MKDFTLSPVGSIETDGEGFALVLKKGFGPALEGLEGFGHLVVLWCFHNSAGGGELVADRPYVKGPRRMGVFATRSPERPNPIALSVARILSVDRERGMVRLDYIDAQPGSPVLDCKPYTPSLDRVSDPQVPEWCAHWPHCIEASGGFDWEGEFDF